MKEGVSLSFSMAFKVSYKEGREVSVVRCLLCLFLPAWNGSHRLFLLFLPGTGMELLFLSCFHEMSSFSF